MRRERFRAYKRAQRSKSKTFVASRNYDSVTVDDHGIKTRRNSRSHNFTVNGTFSGYSGGSTYSNTFPVTLNIEDNVKYGANVPGWRDKMRQGIGVVTTLVGDSFKLKVSYGGSLVRRRTVPDDLEATASGPLGAMSFYAGINLNRGVSDTALQLARSKLLKSYIAQSQSFSGGKFLAEIKDTIELVTHPVRSMYRKTYEYAGTVKRIGKVYQHRPRTAAAALSESWLAYSFGMKPLIGDANDAAKALNRLVQNPRDNMRYIKGIGHDRTVTTRSDNMNFGPGPYPWVNEVRIITDLSVRFEGAFRQQPTGTGNALSEFGLGVFDIIPSVWEGIPWSFFIDYFANVGEVLDAMRLINVDTAWLIRTVRNRTTMTVTPTKQPNTYGDYSVSGGRAEGEGIYVQRTPVDLFDNAPSFQIHLPGTSALRWLNITALAGVVNDSKWGSRPDLENALKDRARKRKSVPFLGSL